MPSRFEHLRAVAVLALLFGVTCLGTPGLDMLHRDYLRPGTAERAKTSRTAVGKLEIAASDVNRWVREPFVRVLTPVQRPLRLAQAWHLYADGPNRVRHLEIRVDGELKFRTADPDHDWLHWILKSRKVRPVVDAHCNGKSANSEGLASYVVRKAREDFGDIRRVDLVCTRRPWPGTAPPKTMRGMSARAPDWEIAR